MDADSRDLLLTAAEIAVAFMGFASLVGVFLARNRGGLPPRIRAAMQSLIDYGLLALLACAVPLVLQVFDPARPHWDLASGIVLALGVLYGLVAHHFYREALAEVLRTGSFLLWLLFIGDFVAYASLGVNATGWPGDRSAAVYFCASVVWFLFGSAISFRGIMVLAWSDDG